MRRKGLYALVLSAIFIGMTAGSAAATVWGVPLGSKSNACYTGISTKVSVAAGVGKVNVDFSVSWNGHYGAAWGVYQYGIWDDKNVVWVGFSHNSKVKVHNYHNPTGFSSLTYHVNLNMGYTHLAYFQWLRDIGAEYVVYTPYSVNVTKVSESWWEHSKSKKQVYSNSGVLQGIVFPHGL